MLLEYLDDPSLAKPVLLVYGDEPRSVALLRTALHAVVQGEPVQLDQLPGFAGVRGCSLALQVGQADHGVRPISDAGANAFECVHRPATWQTVAGLLEPFAAPDRDRGHAHQYLTEAGGIEWIVSTDRDW